MTTDEVIQDSFSWRHHNLPWYPRRGTRLDLANLLGKLGFNKGVEVGVQRGYFSTTLCKANVELKLSCIDPWASGSNLGKARQERIYAQALDNLAPYNITILKQFSLDAVKSFSDNSLDFVYIDGDHSFNAAVQDIIHWTPKVKKGGIVAVHDYHHQCGMDVVYAVNAYTHCHHIDPWYITREELPTAFWVCK